MKTTALESLDILEYQVNRISEKEESWGVFLEEAARKGWMEGGRRSADMMSFFLASSCYHLFLSLSLLPASTLQLFLAPRWNCHPSEPCDHKDSWSCAPRRGRILSETLEAAQAPLPTPMPGHRIQAGPLPADAWLIDR